MPDPKPKFDPTKPYEPVKPKFDPNKPFDEKPEPVDNPDVATPITDFLRTAYSGLVDQVPQTLAQGSEVLKSRINPTDVSEFIKNKGLYDDFQKYVRAKDPEFEGFWSFLTPFDEDKFLPKYGKQFMEDKGLGGQITRMEENLPKVIERRKELEAYVAQQKKEAAEKTVGIPQKYEDISNVGDFASYISGLAGQAAYQVPLSVATRGGSSYLMEAATVYDKQLDQLAAENKLTREEVIERNLDKPAAGQVYAMLAGSLDAVSAGNLINTFRKGGGSLLKKWVTNAVPEAVTESAQSVLENTGAGAPITTSEIINSAIGGAVGGSLFSFAGKSKEGEVANRMITESGDTGDPSVNSQIDADATFTPTEESILKTNIAEKRLTELTDKETELKDAVQKQSTTEVPVQPETGSSEEVRQGNTEESVQETPQEKEVGFNETPEYKAADQKVREIADQIRQNPHQEELFSQLNEAKQERDNARIAFEQKPSKTKQEKSIKMTPAQALKQQVQTFYKGVEKGVKKGKELTNDLVTKVQETLKDYNLSPKQTSVLLSKVRSTNLFTSGSVSKLNTLIDKVSTDAAYAESLSDAESFRSDVRKKSKTKDETISNNYKTVAKEFAKLNPDEVTDLNKYKEIAAHVLGGFAKPGGKQSYNAINIDQVRTFINRENEFKQGEQINRLREEFNFGDEFSDEEVGQLLETDDLDNEEFYKNKDQARKTIARDKILRTAQFAQNGIQEREGSVEETLGKIDLSKLSDGQLVDYVRTVDNIIQNDDYTNSDRIDDIAKAIDAVEKLKGEKATGQIGKFKGSIYNMPMLFNAIYSDSKAASKFILHSYLGEVYNGGSRTEGAEGKLYEDFREKAKEIKQNTKKDPLTADTQIRLGVFTPLVRYQKGTEPNLEQSKRIVEQSIQRLKSKNDRAELANDAERLYEPFKKAQSIEEVFDIMKKIDPAGYQMYEFFNKKFEDEIKDELKYVKERRFNESFIEEENYTPKAMERVDKGVSDSNEISYNLDDIPAKPRQSTTSITATNTLPKGWALNFEFYQNMFRKYRESKYAIETSKPAGIFREFMKLPESTDILGGLENKNRIIENYNKSEEIQRGVGKDYGDISKFMDEVSSTLRTLGYTAALGSVDQVVKQYVPVAVNTMFNLGGDAGLFFSRIPEGTQKLFDQYTIGQRGKRLGGAERGESTRYRIQSKYRKKLLKGVSKIHKLTDKGSSIFMASLTKGDVSVAQRSWVAYYLQDLKKSGVDLKTVDLNTEAEKQNDPIRKEAAAYAEQKVKETQVVSNPAELAKLLRTTGAENWIKNIFIPFSTFSVNTKVRLAENIRQLRTNPNKTDAYKALAGTVSEIALYSTIKYFLLSQAWGLLKEGAEELFDLEAPEEDEEEKKDFRLKQWYSAIYKDMFPFAVGTGGENASIEAANAISYLIEHPDATYSEWKDQLKGGRFYQYQPNNAFDLGLYSIGLNRLQETVKDSHNMYNITQGDPVVTTTPYGDKEVELDSDQQKFMAFMTMMDYLSTVGLTDAGVFNQLKKIQREQLKTKKDQNSNKPYIPKPMIQKPYIHK